MESRLKLLGHPPHQMLVPLPIGLLVGAAGMDLGGWRRDARFVQDRSNKRLSLGASASAAPKYSTQRTSFRYLMRCG